MDEGICVLSGFCQYPYAEAQQIGKEAVAKNRQAAPSICSFLCYLVLYRYLARHYTQFSIMGYDELYDHRPF